MSWGERSCARYGRCTENATMATCNVDCPGYLPNGKEPDFKSKFERLPVPKNWRKLSE